MVFLVGDVYTASGSTPLYNCWNNNVSYMDPSSFYNWEQDNMPIADLDERTYLLWERLGHHTSSLPGISLVVSATAPAGTTGCYRNVFTTLSAALNAVPEVINTPILIEVASFGNLGDFNLTNRRFGLNGSIEIINRNFAKAEPVIPGQYISAPGFDAASPYSTYHLCSSVSSTNLLGYDFGVRGHFVAASALSLSATILSSTTDSRLSSALNGVVAPVYSNGDSRASYIIAERNTANCYNSNAQILNFKAYEYNAPSYESISTYDVSTYNQITSSELVLNTNNVISVVGLFFGNTVNSINIKNCDGPVFLRNFFVDGSGVNKSVDYGILVDNSRVYIENCVATRCQKAGVFISNSNVIVTRGLAAYRNYGYDRTNARKSGTWASKAKNDYFNSASSLVYSDDAAGLLAINSQITVSSTSSFERQIYANDPVWATPAALGYIPIYGANTLFNFSRNANGIVLINSKLTGGASEDKASTALQSAETHLVAELSNEIGIKLENSILDWNGRLHSLNNNIGVKLNNSKLNVEKLNIKANQQRGIDAHYSDITYNKNFLKLYTTDETNYAQLNFSSNGQHLILDNSKFTPANTSGVVESIGQLKFLESHGINQSTTLAKGNLPAVSVRNGSKAMFLHAFIKRVAANTIAGSPCFGDAIEAIDNSKVYLRGSKNYATVILGPDTYSAQKRKTGLYAGKNSLIEMSGPTVIAQFAVDALAEDNSIININPPKTSNGTIDVSSYNLNDKTNHTTVELHSTRACLVANRNSVINLTDLGDYNYFWSGTNGNAAITSGLDYQSSATGELEYATYVSGGSLQFYPNPNDSNPYPPGQASVTSVAGTRFTANGGTFAYNSFNFPYFMNSYVGDTANQNNLSSVTAGGMCVRALNGSKVNVRNVHFPCGYWIPSGIIHDVSGADSSNPLCNRLFIWNIADNSQLYASYCTVSASHPADVGYHGPSGAWVSGAGTVFASGAPISTPDTSSLSVLDYFGICSGNPFGKSTWQNSGPFRLYFSTDPVVNVLTTSGNNTYGYAQQIYAQGYQASAELYASGTVSSLYTSVIKRNASNQLVTSSFWYASSVLDNPGMVRVFLDESAANTFANAKHCAVGKSGIPKLVSIYLPYRSTVIGDSALDSVRNYGRGIKSTNVFDLEKDN